MGGKKKKKKTLWRFQATNNWNITQENVDMTKKEKLEERNWIFSDSTTKQRYKELLCQSKIRRNKIDVDNVVTEMKRSIT